MKTKRPDKHVLYEKAVQAPDADARFIRRVFKRIRGRMPLVLREDFSGTSALCCEWVRTEPGASAYGIDLHKPTLDWARTNNLSKIGPVKNRISLIHGNVLDDHRFNADVAVAFNFSYFCFKKRQILSSYCRKVFDSLKKDGIFFLDIYGGPSSMVVQEEETDHDDFVYLWDQAKHNPVTGDILCHIHFRLPDGKTMRRAFTYDWRLWTIPELTDVLEEAGFGEVQIYWEGTDKDGDGNGVFRHSRKGDDSEAYIAYVAALK